MYTLIKKIKAPIVQRLGIAQLSKRLDETITNKAPIEDIRRLEETIKYLKECIIECAKNRSSIIPDRVEDAFRALQQKDQYYDKSIGSNSRLVFICGLHRSGTSFLARYLGEHPDISSFKHTMVPEDEGQFLQTVFPSDSDIGRPGLFGFIKEAHLTENSHLISDRNKDKLLRQWSKYWDHDKQVFLEKTPSNLLRVRFMQELFPQAKFIIVKRHPIAVSLATQKWSESSIRSLLKHWFHCYGIWERDKKFIRNYIEVKYEDNVADIKGALDEICEFIDLPKLNCDQRAFSNESIRTGINDKYFDIWRSKGWRSTILNHIYSKDFIRHGYDLSEDKV